jgi:hypothetical protein
LTDVVTSLTRLGRLLAATDAESNPKERTAVVTAAVAEILMP